MKKIVSLLMAIVVSSGAFAQQGTPELLTKKELFEKTELFEPQGVFANIQANIKLLKDYEANKASYKPNQLLPVAVCYLSVNALPQAKETFEAFLKVAPKNKRALRTLGTISLLSKENDKAISYFKKAVELGDEQSNIYLASAYLVADKANEVAPILPALKKLAKENLEAFNVIMLYALRDSEKRDVALMKETIANSDARKLLSSASPDGLSTTLRVYLADRSVWTPSMSVIPARAAALMENWLLARKCYRAILESEPKNALALRGMGLVEYRTGDVSSASKYIEDAYKNGDKDAVIDGIELFLLSGRKDIWNTFSPMLVADKLSPQLRAGLVQYAVANDNCKEMFYTAAIGKGSELLYKDEAVQKLLKEGVEKYSSDSRAEKVAKLIKQGIDELKKQKAASK